MAITMIRGQIWNHSYAIRWLYYTNHYQKSRVTLKSVMDEYILNTQELNYLGPKLLYFLFSTGRVERCGAEELWIFFDIVTDMDMFIMYTMRMLMQCVLIGNQLKYLFI